MPTLIAYAQEPKREEHYDYKRQGRAGNPSSSFYDQNHVPIKSASLKLAPQICDRIIQGDPDTIAYLREQLQGKGLQGRTINLRIARGGVGGGRGIVCVKARIAQGNVDTSMRGFKVILRNFEV